MAKAKPGEVRRKRRRGKIVTRYIGEWTTGNFAESMPSFVLRHPRASMFTSALRGKLPFIEVTEGPSVSCGAASPEALARWGDLVEES